MENMMNCVRFIGCLIAITYVQALPTSMESMTLSRVNKADLETSATGYSYHQQQGAPSSYVRYNDHDSGSYYDAPAPVHYVEDAPTPVRYAAPEPSAQVAQVAGYGLPRSTLKLEPIPVEYGKQRVPLQTAYIVPLLPQKKEALAPYYVPTQVNGVPEKVEIVDDDEDEDEDDDDDEDKKDDDDDDDDDDDEDEDDYGYGHHKGPVERTHGVNNHGKGFELGGPVKAAGSAYAHGNGEQYNAEKHASQGQKGDQGYEIYHGFDNDGKEKHGAKSDKGHYSEDEASRKSHSDTAGQYEGHAEGSRGEDGSGYGAATSHKKGHKTRGFHNVYHKDEYKKDTDFYDDAHRGGHFDKHGEFQGYHGSAEAGFKAGGHHASDYDAKEASKDGKFDKGHEYSEDEGHKKAEGRGSYHAEHSDYANRGASKEAKAHGFAKSHGHPSKQTS